MVQCIFKHKPQQKLHGIVVGSEAIDAQIKDVLRISIISIRLYKKSLKKYSILFRNRRVSTRHLCSNKNIYLSESNTNNPKCYLLMQFAVNLAEKKLLN